MDFHLVTENAKTTPKEKNDKVSFIKKFVPVFVLSMFLPFFVLVSLQPNNLRFLTQAGKDTELRIWTEPRTLIATPGTPVEVEVFALYDSSKLIPSLELELQANNPSLKFMTAPNLSKKIPFRGQVSLGKVSFVVNQKGEYQITIPKEKVFIQAALEQIEIITGQTDITIQ